MSEVEHATVVDLGEVPVMFKRVGDDQAAISQGWAEVEEAVGSLSGRKFYGVVDKASGEYRVCVHMREDDDPVDLGLEVGTIPGGRYARVRLNGDPPAVYGLRSIRSSRMKPGGRAAAATYLTAGTSRWATTERPRAIPGPTARSRGASSSEGS